MERRTYIQNADYLVPRPRANEENERVMIDLKSGTRFSQRVACEMLNYFWQSRILVKRPM